MHLTWTPYRDGNNMSIHLHRCADGRITQYSFDPAKSLKRKFPDKDEWRGILRQLQDEGELTFTEERDEIVIPLPAAPDA